MTTIRMYPPPTLTNVTYGMRRVGPEGVDMSERDAKLHAARGWRDEPFPEPKAFATGGVVSSETLARIVEADAEAKPKRAAKKAKED